MSHLRSLNLDDRSECTFRARTARGACLALTGLVGLGCGSEVSVAPGEGGSGGGATTSTT